MRQRQINLFMVFIIVYCIDGDCKERVTSFLNNNKNVCLNGRLKIIAGKHEKTS